MQEEIRKYRLKLGLSQDELAKQVGCKRSTIACYETGVISPSLTIAKKLAKLFGISLDELTTEPVTENDEPLEEPTHVS